MIGISARRSRIEHHALVLSRAIRCLSLAVARFMAVGDDERAERITRLIDELSADRDRWLTMAGSPLRWAFVPLSLRGR